MSKPVAHVINLARRPDRWQRTQELWSDFFNLVRVSAMDIPNYGARGCKLSHWACAQKYLADSASILILEDDAMPTPWWERIGMQCLEESIIYLDDWDYQNYGPFLDLSRIHLPKAVLTKTDSKLFLHTTYSHNTHMVCYNHRSLPLLQASLSSNLPIDMFLGRNAKHQWVPCRVLATQTGSDSDIRTPFFGQENWYADSDAMLDYAALELHPVTPATESDTAKAHSRLTASQ